MPPPAWHPAHVRRNSAGASIDSAEEETGVEARTATAASEAVAAAASLCEMVD